MTAPLVELEDEQVGVYNRRFGVRLADGARVECVLYRGDTLCVSTQVGCAVRCPFCASGAAGYGRNLSHEELLGQLEAIVKRGHGVRRVTLSGVGEPLHNWANAVDFMTTCRASGWLPSLTTSGGRLGRLEQALSFPHNGLTLSVHAGTEPVRARLVPNGPALEPLFELLHAVLPTLTRRRRRKTALAYLMLANENDADAEVDAFIARALPLGLPVHLYAYNPVATSSQTCVSRECYEATYSRMRAAGLVTRMSSQARIEANGGCGTLLALRARPSIAPPDTEHSAGSSS